jgi:glycosyltransferase involved in cell wall biosynthesis
MPVISIIVPVYKAEPYFRRCIDSILAQSFTNFECILINDGSPDGCPVICDEYANKDNRIVVIHQENKGVSAARSAGLDKAQGEWIVFVDGDDTLPVNALQYLWLKAKKENLDIVIGNFNYVTSKEKKIKIFRNEQFFGTDVQSTIKAVFRFKCSGSLCGRLIKKEKCKKILFPSDDIKIGEDIICSVQLIAISKNVSVLNEVIYNYVQHSASAMNSNKPIETNGMGSYIAWFKEYVEYNFPQLTSDCTFFLLKEYFTYLMRGGKWEKKHGISNLFSRFNKKELPIKMCIAYYSYAINIPIGNFIIKIARVVSLAKRKFMVLLVG